MLGSPWRFSVVLAYAAFILVGLGTGVSGVLLPAQIDDYGVDKATVGITFFAFSAGFMLAGASSGALIHRLGTRIALAVGGGAFVAAALYTAIRPSFIGLIVVQLFVGYGTGLLESVLNTYLTGLPSATTLLNRLHAFFGVGALLGPLLAAWLVGFLPWTAVWLVLGLIAVPLVIGFLVVFPRREVAAAGEAVQTRLLPTVLRSPVVVLASVFLAVYVGLEIGVGNWGFTFLVDEHAQVDLVAGYTVSGYWLGLTLGRFLISPIAVRFGVGPTGITFGCLAGVTASAALIWVAPGYAVAAVGFVLLGFFLGPIFPTAMAVVPNLVPDRLVPTAIGVMNGVSVVGGSVLPWMAGAIAQSVGVWTLMPFAIVLGLVQVGIWRMIVSRSR
ncbi:MFS transporter [Acrocarpospora corrugata]|uniref:MFS transporter n=1 Tax=Acrocarpospora corrugata TaxID=35763 RepID=UPI001C3FB5CB|nr:MFS transporter [Acrocarpospora corrugata]